MERGQVLGVSHPGPVPRHIDVVATSAGSSSEGVVGVRLAGEEEPIVIAMEGEVQNPVSEGKKVSISQRHGDSQSGEPSPWRWPIRNGQYIPLVIVEHMLCGVAMVNIPVHNQYTTGH